MEVKSADGKYGIDYQQKTGEIITITGNQSIDKVSTEDQNEVLKVLKGLELRSDDVMLALDAVMSTP
ncbi:hypothetical protein ABEX25_25925 [Paenibacillus thiaminolyticus]|uniref:hypothetical protein n=1 Tax=Paenibacillus thiaminolyticus TaxID=49283 RepID=UPI003D2D1C79